MKLEVLPPAQPFAIPGLPMRTAQNKKSIEIVKLFFLRGPGIWTYRPVLEAWVDIGELEDFPSNTIPGLYERLSAWLPTLIEHRCGIGERGGFLQRLRDGTWPGHILEHVMIELQNLADIPTGFGKARETSRRGVYKVVVRTPDEEIGRAALYAARDLLMAAIEDRAFDVTGTVEMLRRLAAERSLGADATMIVDAAAERRIPSIRLNDGGLVQLGHGARQRRVWMGKAAQGSAIAQGIAEDRLLNRSLLSPCGVPVPEGRAVDSAEDAWEAAQDIGVPVVVKPGDSRCGCGVSVDLRTREEVEAAYALAREKSREVLVERFIPGAAHRLLIVGGRMVAAVRKEKAAGGEHVACDVTDAVHPEIAAMASLAARIVGLDIAGVDLVAQDIACPLQAQGGAIIDVDAMPDLQMHGKPAQDAARPVGHAIVDHLFAGQENGRIPLVGISGSHGRTSVARLVATLLQSQGSRVGLACGDGLYLGRRQLAQGDSTDWQSAQRLLRNPAVDAAVFEHTWHGMLAEGLGYDRCMVGIVTSLDCADVVPDYDINDAEQMQKVIRTQVDVVLPDGAAILNAADPAVVQLASLCDGEVIFFGEAADLPAIVEHRERQGRVVFIKDGQIVFATGAETTAVPLVRDDRRSGDVESMLAAAGAAWALGLSFETIRVALQAFQVESSAALTATALVKSWSQNASAQTRKVVHGNIADQGIARPESLEPANGDRSHCDMLRA